MCLWNAYINVKPVRAQFAQENMRARGRRAQAQRGTNTNTTAQAIRPMSRTYGASSAVKAHKEGMLPRIKLLYLLSQGTSCDPLLCTCCNRGPPEVHYRTSFKTHRCD